MKNNSISLCKNPTSNHLAATSKTSPQLSQTGNQTGTFHSSAKQHNCKHAPLPVRQPPKSIFQTCNISSFYLLPKLQFYRTKLPFNFSPYDIQITDILTNFTDFQKNDLSGSTGTTPPNLIIVPLLGTPTTVNFKRLSNKNIEKKHPSRIYKHPAYPVPPPL